MKNIPAIIIFGIGALIGAINMIVGIMENNYGRAFFWLIIFVFNLVSLRIQTGLSESN